MCIFSMVIDSGQKELERFIPQYPINTTPWDYQTLKDRVEVLEKKMEQAMELDAYLKQPDCESAIKKAKLQSLADKLGVKIKFPKGL